MPSMVKNNHGHVVALSSMAGIMGIANLVPYCGSKFAVRGIMESLSEELREDARKIDINFTTICPFIVDTGLCKKPRARYDPSPIHLSIQYLFIVHAADIIVNVGLHYT